MLIFDIFHWLSNSIVSNNCILSSTQDLSQLLHGILYTRPELFNGWEGEGVLFRYSLVSVALDDETRYFETSLAHSFNKI